MDMGKINQAFERLSSGKFFKMRDGKNKIRMLPPVDGSGVFFLELVLHYGFNDGDRERTYPCRSMYEQNCPVCHFVKALKDSDDKSASKLANRLRQNQKFLSNIVDRKDNKIKIWSYNAKMLRGIMGYVQDEDYGENIFDPETGFDFSITKSGSGLKTRYSEPRVSPRPKPVGIEGWENQCHDLKSEVEEIGYDELVQSLEENFGEFVDELELDFENNKRKTKRKKVKSDPEEDIEDDEEEDEDEEDDDFEEIEEEPKPKKKKRLKNESRERNRKSKRKLQSIRRRKQSS